MQLFNDHIARQMAEQLLAIEAIQLNVHKPFTWASGLQAPIYCDNRKALGYPAIRTFTKSCLVDLVQQQFVMVEGITGVATAGIAPGALLADSLQLPFLYVRSKAKTHGLANTIEGHLADHQKLVVVEDLISTGQSALQVCNTLARAGATVLGVVAIFNYGLAAAKDNFNKAGLPLFSLSNYATLLQIAQQKGVIDIDTVQCLQSWQHDPVHWRKEQVHNQFAAKP